MSAETLKQEQYSVEFLADETSFDPLSLCPAAMFTQSDLYYRWQLAAGKRAKRFLVKANNKTVAYAQCFFTPVRFLMGRGYWYAPYGPVCAPDADRQKIADAIETAFSKWDSADTPPAAFFRLDFFPALASTTNNGICGAEPAPCARFLVDGSLQPRSEWVLPLAPSPEEILAAMHPKARYSIQYAQRKSVVTHVVSEHFSKHLETFCRLMKETAHRDAFIPHSDTYYKALFSQLDITKQGFLTIGVCEEEVVSVALAIGYGKTITYVFGASANTHRNVSASALVQWTAILEAKRLGYERYNFGGISSARFPMKTWQGITTFKRRFGGYEQVHSPISDIVFQPLWYGVFVLRKWAKRYLHI